MSPETASMLIALVAGVVALVAWTRWRRDDRARPVFDAAARKMSQQAADRIAQGLVGQASKWGLAKWPALLLLALGGGLFTPQGQSLVASLGPRSVVLNPSRGVTAMDQYEVSRQFKRQAASLPIRDLSVSVADDGHVTMEIVPHGPGGPGEKIARPSEGYEACIIEVTRVEATGLSPEDVAGVLFERTAAEFARRGWVR